VVTADDAGLGVSAFLGASRVASPPRQVHGKGFAPSNLSAGFSSSCSAFNRFAHGNRKLPCSTLSGVECLPYTPCEARLKSLNPSTALWEQQTERTTVPESPRFPAANQRRNRDQIGQLKQAGIREGSAAHFQRQGRATHRRGQHPNPRLKEKLLEHPGNPTTYPEPSSAPGSLALAAQKRKRQLLCGAGRMVGVWLCRQAL
jgi:hypothetical protein